jgi:AraC-like DNA-binding protein
MPPQLKPPAPALAPYVATFWAVERTFRPADRPFAILPDSSIELVCFTGAQAWIDDGTSRQSLPSCYLVGLLDRPLTLRAEGTLRVAAARLFAWSLYPLLGADFTPRGVTLHGLDQRLSERTAAVVAQLEAGDLAAALACLEAVLLERAARLPRPPSQAWAAAQALVAAEGTLGVAELSARQHHSVRQIERQVQAAVGRSPKALARLARFQQVRDRLYADPAQDLAALATDLGYSDQAHLSREFKAFSQRTPRQFSAEMQAARALLATGVTFLQDP